MHLRSPLAPPCTLRVAGPPPRHLQSSLTPPLTRV
jgi:hypothetical protein